MTTPLDVKQLSAVPIEGDPSIVTLTICNNFGERMTIVVHALTGDGMLFDEDVWQIRDRRIIGGILIMPREFKMIAAAYRVATGKRLRKPAWVRAHESICSALEEDSTSFTSGELT